MGNAEQAQINFPESGRGLGHVTPTIFGSTVGYPSDSLVSCECFCQISSKLILIIFSYTVSKLVRFFETQCSTDADIVNGASRSVLVEWTHGLEMCHWHVCLWWRSVLLIDVCDIMTISAATTDVIAVCDVSYHTVWHHYLADQWTSLHSWPVDITTRLMMSIVLLTTFELWFGQEQEGILP